MKLRKVFGLLAIAFAVSGTVGSDAKAALVQVTCTVTSVGWRENARALRTVCGGTVFWNRETSSHPTCTHKTSMDAIKMWQTTGDAALLSGKSVQMYYDTQAVCNTTELVIREMYLLN